MSELYLTDVVIRCPSDSDNIIPDGACMFFEVFVGGNSVKRTGQFLKELTGPSWRLDETIHVSDNFPSTRLIVMVEYPSHDSQQLGFVDLVIDDLLAQCAEEKYEIIRPLIKNGDGPPLELVSHCIVIPPDIPPDHPFNMFEDTVEEEVYKRRFASALLSGQMSTTDPVPNERILADVKYERALNLSDENAKKLPRLIRAAIMFFDLFERSHTHTDLDKAITVYEAAVRLTPDGHQFQAALLGKLGVALLLRIQYSGDITDMDNAIFSFEYGAMLTPDGHADKLGCLSNLGTCLLRRFEHSGNIVDIDRAISVHEHAVHLTPDDHAKKPSHLIDLGSSFECRFERSGDLAEIHKAISALERADHLTPDSCAEKPRCLDNLGTSFLARFERSGDLIDIDKAISAHERAVHLTPNGHADQPGRLHNLGTSFLLRFQHSGNVVDSDKAISAHERAVDLVPDGHAKKHIFLNNLGNSFSARFDHSGDLVYIDKAISAHERAVHLTPNGHAEKPACLHSLGSSFLHRFRHSGDLIDIGKAISALERAVHLTPDGHAKKPGCWNNLGSSFLRRFESTKDLVDIDRAVSAHKQAVHLTPDGHAEEPRHLNSLGSSFMCHFECSRDLIDIDRAVSVHERAVHLTPDGHVDKPRRLNNLGESFLVRFNHSGDLVDIDKAISAHEQAVHLTPNGHADKPCRLKNLGQSFLCRSKCSEDLVDRSTAIAHFRCAASCSTGPPSIRFHAALQWARLASTWQISSALQGYAVAFDLLPQVTWMGQTILARHSELTSMDNIASEAAATAIFAEQYDTALEWLEQGRSIVWSQLLDLRTPVDAIREKEPGLADDLVRVSQALEHAGNRDTSTQDLSPQLNQNLSMEQVAQSHHRLAEEWERLVERARAIPGFEDFLRPKKLVQLRSAAKAGPVVVVNVHKQCCDALVLIPGLDDVMHIPLDGFSYEKGQELHQLLNRLLSNAGVRVRDLRGPKLVTTRQDESFQDILSVLWTCVVKPVLDGLAFSISHTADPPRIWWCATGPLAFLPIHAAGIYDKSAPGYDISDYVVSSYTPTLNALINATQSRELLRKFQGLLAVSQPNTPEQSQLPNTTVEMTHIKQHALDKFVVYPLDGSVASVKSVIEGMESHSWVHLACHAVQNRAEPTKSAFCLHDGCLELSTIITKQFPHADFAFLSACQTATGDEKLSEEAVHLAAGLLLAGYRSVIATMWSIKDEDAPVIADRVYSELFSDTEPDSTKAALALHHAVKRLREVKGVKSDSAFLSWVPFVHVGV